MAKSTMSTSEREALLPHVKRLWESARASKALLLAVAGPVLSGLLETESPVDTGLVGLVSESLSGLEFELGEIKTLAENIVPRIDS